jgi:hypothetical protein
MNSKLSDYVKSKFMRIAQDLMDNPQGLKQRKKLLKNLPLMPLVFMLMILRPLLECRSIGLQENIPKLINKRLCTVL